MGARLSRFSRRAVCARLRRCCCPLVCARSLRSPLVRLLHRSSSRVEQAQLTPIEHPALEQMQSSHACTLLTASVFLIARIELESADSNRVDAPTERLTSRPEQARRSRSSSSRTANSHAMTLCATVPLYTHDSPCSLSHRHAPRSSPINTRAL